MGERKNGDVSEFMAACWSTEALYFADIVKASAVDSAVLGGQTLKTGVASRGH